MAQETGEQQPRQRFMDFITGKTVETPKNELGVIRLRVGVLRGHTGQLIRLDRVELTVEKDAWDKGVLIYTIGLERRGQTVYGLRTTAGGEFEEQIGDTHGLFDTVADGNEAAGDMLDNLAHLERSGLLSWQDEPA